MFSRSVHIQVHSDNSGEQISELPQSPGIYVLQAPGKPPHLSWCPNLRKRITRLLDPSYTLLRRIRESMAQIECWPAGSKLESMLLMCRLAKQYFPHDYMKRTRLRLPTFLALLDGDGFARLGVVRDIPRKTAGAGLWGPFPSRDAAEWYGEEVSALFQLRRCTDVLSPHPEHPGCIYGEMNQCLRPCQARVSFDEYRSEEVRVRQFLADNGKSATAALSEGRERASQAMDFEQAALIHKRIEKVQAAISARDKTVAELQNFHGVALTAGSTEQELKLWPMWRGLWQAPVVLDFTPVGDRRKPLDVEIRERLTESFSSPHQDGSQAEDLAVFSRWYFSSWREGEWYPFRSLNELNYRKLVRDLSKISKGRVPAGTSAPSDVNLRA
jgi:excinuclease ABC subunit C